MVQKQTINSRRAIDVNINASIEFADLVMYTPSASFLLCLENVKPFGLPCVSLSVKHRPGEKWMAVRFYYLVRLELDLPQNYGED